MGRHFPRPDHQHKKCIDRIKSSAIEQVENSGRKFGANQLLVLDALLQDHNTVSAYNLVERLALDGKRLQPVQVYRALDGLMEMGVVHRIQSRNAFIACDNPGNCDSPKFLLCSSCERGAEIASDAVTAVISKAAEQTDFVLQQEFVELIGLCPDCANKSKKIQNNRRMQ